MNENKILLADDAKLFLELEKSFLQRSGIEILTASNGRQALELAREHHPRIAFLDLNMPELSGDKCCRAIKQDPELVDTAVVMVTTDGRPKDHQLCLDAGCDKVLLKPINRKEFLATAEALLQMSTRNERYRTSIAVHYGENEATPLVDFSIDVSTGGLYINTENPLEVGESMVLRFSLPRHSRPITCRAKVAWVNSPKNPKKMHLPPGMGIQFVEMALENLRQIRYFIDSNDLEPAW